MWMYPAICVMLPLLVLGSTHALTLTDLVAFEEALCGNEVRTWDSPGPPGTNIIPEIADDTGCCLRCSRNTTTCAIEDSCCLSVLDQLPSVEESSRILKMTCAYPQLKPYTLGGVNADSNVKMLRQCSNNHNVSEDIIARCEHADMYTELYTQVPVSDESTGLAYQNTYCGLCNGVPEERLTHWGVHLACNEGTFHADNITAIVEEVLSTSTCNLMYYALFSNSIEPLHVLQCSEWISTCNETGVWQVYDKDIEAACHAYTTVYKQRYKNVFCFICNSDNSTESDDLCLHGDSSSSFDSVSFSAVLTLPAPDSGEKIPSSCTPNEIYDPIKVCSIVCYNV